MLQLGHACCAAPAAQVSLSLAASNLDNVETWSKSDPFVRISKMRESGEWVPVVKTEASQTGPRHACSAALAAGMHACTARAAASGGTSQRCPCPLPHPAGHPQQPEPRLAPVPGVNGSALQRRCSPSPAVRGGCTARPLESIPAWYCLVQLATTPAPCAKQLGCCPSTRRRCLTPRQTAATSSSGLGRAR